MSDPAPTLVNAPRRVVSLAVLVTVLHLASPRAAQAESYLQVKYEDYRENDGRIHVAAKYGLAQIDLNDATQLTLRGVIDTITGSSPTGEPAPDGSDQVPVSSLEDVRHAAVASLAHAWGDWRVSGEFAWSKEDDYLSLGYSTTLARSFNQKNTELQLGFSFIDDAVQPAFFATAQAKTSRDFLIGINQLLGPNTRLTANVAYGTSSGYLDDPYKIVLKNIELAPGLELGITFPEHRPARKEKLIGFVEVAHYLEKMRAGVESSVRWFHDDHGITSTTLEAAWRQRVGERWIVGPLLRWYRQSAADYYHPDLNNTTIDPVTTPDVTTPFYSSDYRLSAFDATTVGAKVVCTLSERWAFDLTYERYAMKGRDGVTSDSAYATANILTLGGRFTF